MSIVRCLVHFQVGYFLSVWARKSTQLNSKRLNDLKNLFAESITYSSRRKQLDSENTWKREI